jgi:hypothetical protein
MLKVSTLSGEHQVLLYATHDFARDHVVTDQAFLSMQLDEIPADILLYLLECLELEDVLLLLSVRGYLRSRVHRPDVSDRAEILDLLQTTKTVRQSIALDSDFAANPIRQL